MVRFPSLDAETERSMKLNRASCLKACMMRPMCNQIVVLAEDM